MSGMLSVGLPQPFDLAYHAALFQLLNAASAVAFLAHGPAGRSVGYLGRMLKGRQVARAAVGAVSDQLTAARADMRAGPAKLYRLVAANAHELALDYAALTWREFKMGLLGS
jgi:hypothetical protein